MFAVTGGVNTHRGAIWALGLLAAAAAMVAPGALPAEIAALGAGGGPRPIRSVRRRRLPGHEALRRSGRARRGEARFPARRRRRAAGPADAREAGRPERLARLDALVALIASVDDTCLLHRGGRAALRDAQTGPSGARRRGNGTAVGRRALRSLEAALLRHNAAPGGSADLLAAALFLDALDHAAGASSRR